MSDRELLELAAKAAGYEVRRGGGHLSGMLFIPVANPNGLVTGREWNPITDDGDALRLAVRLNLSADFFDDFIRVGFVPNDNEADQVAEPTEPDPHAATRRAIVRAAAEIGRGMGGSNG